MYLVSFLCHQNYERNNDNNVFSFPIRSEYTKAVHMYGTSMSIELLNTGGADADSSRCAQIFKILSSFSGNFQS